MATLTVYRQKLAEALGGAFGVFTATGGSNTTLVCPGAFAESILPTSALAYAWIYVPGATFPKQRRVTATGLNAGSGTITVDGAFGAPVANGSVFEVHGLFPAMREASADSGMTSRPGLRELINQALRMILVPDVLSITLQTNQRDYALGAYPWLDRPERIVALREPNLDATTTRPSWRHWELREDVDGQILHVPQPWRFSSGSYVASLQVLRPADTKIRASGVWGDSTVGLVNDPDEAGPDIQAVVTVAAALAYRWLAARGGARAAAYGALYEATMATAAKIRYFDAGLAPAPAQEAA